MSSSAGNALKEKISAIDGFLNIIRTNPGIPLPNSQFAVMFAPVDSPGGAMKPHYSANVDDLKAFLAKLGLTAPATNNIVANLEREYHSSVRLFLTQDRIDLI